MIVTSQDVPLKKSQSEMCPLKNGIAKSLTTPVLATTDPNLLVYGSTAVAKDTGYCCRSVIHEVGVCGGAHSRWMYVVADLDLRSVDQLPRCSMPPPKQQE